MRKGNRTNHPPHKGQKIRPYKGGRTASLHILVRPEIKDDLELLAKKYYGTPGDILEALITLAVTDHILEPKKEAYEQ